MPTGNRSLPTGRLWTDLAAGTPVTWVNPHRTGRLGADLGLEEVRRADERLRRFAPFLADTFEGPWPPAQPGIIESSLTRADRVAEALHVDRPLWIKRDDTLPVSGSIKARGGIYEVLVTAERLALDAGWGSGRLEDADYRDFAGDDLQHVMSRHTITVGSTGNLGLSIGIMARALGFRAVVHMSADARAWKKARLRSLGADVVEYDGDYGLAVRAGREQARDDPAVHFVDDENSRDLFVGYAVAALRFREQLQHAGLTVDRDHPLHVHLPCGVGGGPGGIAYGLRLVFGDLAEHVHTWYAEPTTACCMTLALATGLGDDIAVTDVGLDGRTEADGLAVGRASRLAWEATREIVAGAFTVTDADMLRLLRLTHQCAGIALEPSAAAALGGPAALARAGVLLPAGGSHVAWATGGSMVPAEQMRHYLSSRTPKRS